MGSITLKEYKKKENALSSKPYTYVDLSLDLSPRIVSLETIKGNQSYRDIEVSYDEFAIKNSLINIFNTIPGQRFLIPLFGCNLIAYLFQPVSETYGQLIGREIQRAIELWEPRVTLDSIRVVGHPDRHEYDVDIAITIPNLKIKTNLTGIIGQSGFRESAL